MEQNVHGTKEGATPPYTSFSSLKTLIKNLKENGLPSRIDRSVLGNSFSNAVGSQLLTALKFLRLIDGQNHPTSDLKDLVEAHGTDQWAGALQNIIRSAYGPLFQLNLETASPAQFNERFRTAYTGADDVQRKSMTFFLGAAKDAGIVISQYIMKNKKPRSGVTKKRAPKANGGGTSTRESGHEDPPPPKDETTQKTPSEILLSFFNPLEMKKEEQEAVWVLLKYFRAKGQ